MKTTLALLILLIVLSLISIRFEASQFMERDSTDVIRGIAILGIALHHTYKLGTLLGAFGALGTGIFFALSGYGNYLSLRKNSGGGTIGNGCLKESKE